MSLISCDLPPEDEVLLYIDALYNDNVEFKNPVRSDKVSKKRDGYCFKCFKSGHMRSYCKRKQLFRTDDIDSSYRIFCDFIRETKSDIYSFQSGEDVSIPGYFVDQSAAIDAY